MPTKSNAGRSQDRKKVAGGQEHEVQYEKDKMKTSGEKVKETVKKVGNSRKKVEEDLKSGK